MPLYFVYTMVQKSQKWPKTQIKGGSCLKDNSVFFWTLLILRRIKKSEAPFWRQIQEQENKKE